MRLVGRAPLWITLFAAVACQSADNGVGRVDARFSVEECRPSGDFELQDYGWDAGRVDTRRFANSLHILLQRHRVSLEQADGLQLSIEDVRGLRADSTRPLVRTIDGARGVMGALSLFDTCPDRPTLNISAGQVVFTRFDVAEDPDDTGTDEHVVGTVTGTLAAVDGSRAGTITATFDFFPEKAPVSEPR